MFGASRGSGEWCAAGCWGPVELASIIAVAFYTGVQQIGFRFGRAALFGLVRALCLDHAWAVSRIRHEGDC